MSPLATALANLAARRDLTANQTRAAVAQIIDGQATEATIAAFLTALKLRGETAEALAGAVQAVRERMTPLDVPDRLRPLLDTCGTGGDGAHTVNVSTAAALVAAACGVRVAKHGNRSASGNSGSAEVLTELGVTIDAEPPVLLRALDELGIAFLFAPRFHPALRHAGPVRRQLPFRTLFNLIGPLANPARPEHQIIGVPDDPTARLVAAALAMLDQPPAARVAVVCGDGRFDEVTPWATTRALWLGKATDPPSTWSPEDFGSPTPDLTALKVSGPADSAARIRRVLAGQPGPERELVVANAAVALTVATAAGGLREGLARAREAIDSGAAARLLGRWAELSGKS